MTGSSTADREDWCSLVSPLAVCLIIQHTWAETHLPYQLRFGQQSVQIALQAPSLPPSLLLPPSPPHLPWPHSLHFTPRSLPVMKIMKQLCGSPSSSPPPFICPYSFCRLLFSLLNYTKSGRETTHMLHKMHYFNVLSKWQINHEIIMCTDTTDLLQEVETISHSCIQLYDSTVTPVHFYQQLSTNRCNTNQTFKRKSRHLYMQYILVLLVSITNSCKKWFKRCHWFCQPKQLGRLS